jgi:hypothetical protein
MKNISKILILGSMVFWQVQANTENNLSYEKLLPQYISWAITTDQEGMKIGTPLDEKELLLAKEIGIKFPEKVRVIYVDEVPYPYENEHLKQMGLSLGFIGDDIVNEAQVFGYSIYVRKDLKFTFSKLAHELVHVMQIERTGSFSVYCLQYLADLAKYGYRKAPLEVEAFKANIKYGARKLAEQTVK